MHLKPPPHCRWFPLYKKSAVSRKMKGVVDRNSGRKQKSSVQRFLQYHETWRQNEPVRFVEHLRTPCVSHSRIPFVGQKVEKMILLKIAIHQDSSGEPVGMEAEADQKLSSYGGKSNLRWFAAYGRTLA